MCPIPAVNQIRQCLRQLGVRRDGRLPRGAQPVHQLRHQFDPPTFLRSPPQRPPPQCPSTRVWHRAAWYCWVLIGVRFRLCCVQIGASCFRLKESAGLQVPNSKVTVARGRRRQKQLSKMTTAERKVESINKREKARQSARDCRKRKKLCEWSRRRAREIGGGGGREVIRGTASEPSIGLAAAATFPAAAATSPAAVALVARRTPSGSFVCASPRRLASPSRRRHPSSRTARGQDETPRAGAAERDRTAQEAGAPT